MKDQEKRTVADRFKVFVKKYRDYVPKNELDNAYRLGPFQLNQWINLKVDEIEKMKKKQAQIESQQLQEEFKSIGELLRELAISTRFITQGMFKTWKKNKDIKDVDRFLEDASGAIEALDLNDFVESEYNKLKTYATQQV